MIKPQNFKKGDKIAIVSLSKGILGMPFCKHELEIAVKRLKEFGLEPVIMPNALKDMKYIEEAESVGVIPILYGSYNPNYTGYQTSNWSEIPTIIEGILIEKKQLNIKK